MSSFGKQVAVKTASFMNTLEVGKRYEDVMEYIFNMNKKYNKVIRPGGKFSDYDIKFVRNTITGKLFLTLEVKADLLAFKTGNMCVEFETKASGLSGISITKALRWIHILHNYDNNLIEYIDIPTSKLREYIKENTPYSMWGGNKKSSHFYLIPHSIFEDYKYILDVSTLPVELSTKIREIPRFVVSV